jgi:hypothetical protein
MGTKDIRSKVVPLRTEKGRDTAESSSEMSLIRGGPAYKFQQLAHLIVPGQWNLRRRILAAVFIAWVPLVVLTIATAGEKWPVSLGSLLRDYRVNARLFLAVPLLIISQMIIEGRFQQMLSHFLNAELIKAEALPQFQDILSKAKGLRDSWLAEGLILVAVYAQVENLASNAANLGDVWVLGRSGDAASLSAAGWYFALVSLPIFLLLLGVALWKWAIWVFVLYRFSRLPLQLVPSDPDLTGGLGFLGWVPTAFVPVILAAGVVISATWRYQILHGVITLQSLTMPAVVLVVLVLFLFFAPLAVFSPLLMELRRTGIHEYAALGHIHARQFHRKWIEHGRQHEDELLAAPEVSILCDLSTDEANVRSMRAFPFQKQVVMQVLLAIALPMIPVVTTQIPLKTLLKEILSALR